MWYNKEKYTFDDFKKIIEILRSPEGCPWDREQTHNTIRNEFIEETYEAVDAIDRGDKIDLCEELGDVLTHLTVGLVKHFLSFVMMTFSLLPPTTDATPQITAQTTQESTYLS